MPPPTASGDFNSHPEFSGCQVISVMRVTVLFVYQVCSS